MERKYIPRIKDLFRKLDSLPPIETLNISDEYIFMHPKLVELLKEGVEAALEEYYGEQD